MKFPHPMRKAEVETPPAGGTDLRAWVNELPEEIRGEKAWSSVKAGTKDEAFPVIAKGYVESQKMLGGMVKIPGADSTPEEKNAFYTKLGRPESPEKYALDLPKQEGVTWNEELLGRYRNFAHKQGLNNDQTNAFIRFYMELEDNDQRVAKELYDQAEQTLREEWGAGYDRNLTLANRALAKFGTPGMKAMLKETGIGNHPEVIRTWVRVAQAMAEDNLIDGRIEGVPGQEEAKKKMESLMVDKAYWNKSDPRHRAIKDEIAALREIAYPNEMAAP